MLKELSRKVSLGSLNPGRQGRSNYQKLPKLVQPRYVDTEIQRTENQAINAAPRIQANIPGLDPEKMPSHIFFLGSSSNGDELTLNDIDELTSELNLDIETQMANSAPVLNYLLGDTSSEHLEMFQQMFNTKPLDLKSLKNPPLILVDPFLFIGKDSKTTKHHDGKDLIDQLNNLITTHNINSKQAPRIMIVRASKDPIKLEELQSRYSAVLDSYPKSIERDLYSGGLAVVKENDLKEILTRYQKSL